MEIPTHHESAIELTISPDLLSAAIDEPIALTCTITNHRVMVFRMRKAWDFTRDGDANGTLRCDITLDGKIYDDWKDHPCPQQTQRWSPDDVVALKQGESHTFVAQLTSAYPLLQSGNYALQAIFCPAELKGVRVSKCKPVYSNLVNIVLD